MSLLLWRSLSRHLTRHPWQLALSVLGIAMGVAVVIAVDLANASARRSFDLSMERIAGRTTHRIVGGAAGVPEALYAQLRVELGLQDMAPMVTGYVAPVDAPDRQLQVLGVDLFAEAPFRGYLAGQEGTEGDPIALLTRPGAALLPEGLNPSEPLAVRAGDREFTLHPVGRLAGESLEGIVITDIATAQALFGRPGRLDHVDLIIPDDPSGQRLATLIRSRLTPDLKLERAAERNQATVEMSAAFSLNLTAMSLLALVVGMFLIYNTMTFSVVQRRTLLGLLRALGVGRREIFAVILGEALLLGIAGTLLGALLGLWLGSGLVHLVTRTINDLYYVLDVREYHIAFSSLAKGIGLGIVVTLIAAWLPAREAAAAPPGAALSRAQLEHSWRSALPRLSALGLVMVASSALVLTLSDTLPGGFAGLFLLILGCALLTPGGLSVLAALNRRFTTRAGLLARMATRDVTRHLSRTGVAVSALVVAFSTTVGVGVMVDSFRGGVTLWLNDLLNADLYIAPAAFETGDNSVALKPQVIEALGRNPAIAHVSTYRHRRVEVGGRRAALVALDLAAPARAGYRLIRGDPESAWHGFDNRQAVIISEPLSYRTGLTVGDDVVLDTDRGPQRFPVAGVFLDYGSEHGRILLARQSYTRYWDDATINSAAAYGTPGENLDALRDRLQAGIGHLQPLVIRSNRHLVDTSLEVFERTFTITNVLRLLAIAVAFIGMLSALMALQLERGRELAMLRANGMTPGQVGWLVTLQTGFMGFAAGVLSIPVGLGLAAVLILVINRRAFGWTLPFTVDGWILAQSVVLAMAAALLAGLYPIWRMARSRPADALRSE